MDEEFELRKKLVLHYKERHIGQFVTITKRDNYKIKGIFKEITPDFLLYIEGKYCTWRIDPLDIKDFYGRADRFPGGEQNS